MTLLCVFIAGFLPQFSVTVRKIPIFRIWCALIVFAAAAAIVYAALKPGVFATLGTRFVYYRDTVRFMEENFWFSPRMLIGFGPGSWRILYYGFQSTPYNVICLHSGFLQLLFENGSFFTILFFGMLLRAVYLHCKHGDRFRCALLMMILVHSLVILICHSAHSCGCRSYSRESLCGARKMQRNRKNTMRFENDRYRVCRVIVGLHGGRIRYAAAV